MEDTTELTTDVSPRLIFRTKDKEFQAHPTSFRENTEQSPFGTKLSSSPVQFRHLNESPVEALRRRESRKSIVSSPLLQSSDSEYVNEIAESSDYRESGLKKLKSRSWESIARWEKENEFLFALIEDESEWLTRLFPDDPVTPDNFFTSLEDGVILCKLAQLCQRYAEQFAKENNTKIPTFFFTIHAKNRCRGRFGQFMSRENVELFLKWCRIHKIPEPLLFESNDVVEKTEKDGMREGAREIVLCLMEVARLGVKYGVQAPKLILLEKEIELEELYDTDGSVSPISVDSGVDTNELELLQAALHEQETVDSNESQKESKANEKINDSCDNNKRNNSEIKDNTSSKTPRRKTSGGKSELHKVVTSILQNYNVGKITRLKEGKYIILGKVMFVRMLNDHCIVRIGGGWDTLEHYIMTHVGKAVPDSFESDSGENLSPSLKRKSIPRKKSATLQRNSNLTKSTPNLLLAVDPAETSIESQKSASKSGSSSPVLKPSNAVRSKDPYFFEKEQQRYDQRKISEAILKVQLDVVDTIKKSASLDWTHLIDKKDTPRKHSHSLTPGKLSLVMADIKIDQTDSSVPKITKEPPTPKNEKGNPLDSKNKKKPGSATKPKYAKAAPVVRQTATSAMRTSKPSPTTANKPSDVKTSKTGSSHKVAETNKTEKATTKSQTTKTSTPVKTNVNKTPKSATGKLNSNVDNTKSPLKSAKPGAYKNVPSRIDSGTRPTSAKKPATPKTTTSSTSSVAKSTTTKSTTAVAKSSTTKSTSTTKTSTTKTTASKTVTKTNVSTKVDKSKAATKTPKSKESKPTAKVSPTKKVSTKPKEDSAEIVTLEKAEIIDPPQLTSETSETRQLSSEIVKTVKTEEKEVVKVPTADNEIIESSAPKVIETSTIVETTNIETSESHSVIVSSNDVQFTPDEVKPDATPTEHQHHINETPTEQNINSVAYEERNVEENNEIIGEEQVNQKSMESHLKNDPDDLYCVTPLNDVIPPITPSSDICETENVSQSNEIDQSTDFPIHADEIQSKSEEAIDTSEKTSFENEETEHSSVNDTSETPSEMNTSNEPNEPTKDQNESITERVHNVITEDISIAPTDLQYAPPTEETEYSSNEITPSSDQAVCGTDESQPTTPYDDLLDTENDKEGRIGRLGFAESGASGEQLDIKSVDSNMGQSPSNENFTHDNSEESKINDLASSGEAITMKQDHETNNQQNENKYDENNILTENESPELNAFEVSEDKAALSEQPLKGTSESINCAAISYEDSTPTNEDSSDETKQALQQVSELADSATAYDKENETIIEGETDNNKDNDENSQQSECTDTGLEIDVAVAIGEEKTKTGVELNNDLNTNDDIHSVETLQKNNEVQLDEEERSDIKEGENESSTSIDTEDNNLDKLLQAENNVNVTNDFQDHCGEKSEKSEGHISDDKNDFLYEQPDFEHENTLQTSYELSTSFSEKDNSNESFNIPATASEKENEINTPNEANDTSDVTNQQEGTKNTVDEINMESHCSEMEENMTTSLQQSETPGQSLTESIEATDTQMKDLLESPQKEDQKLSEVEEDTENVDTVSMNSLENLEEYKITSSEPTENTVLNSGDNNLESGKEVSSLEENQNSSEEVMESALLSTVTTELQPNTNKIVDTENEANNEDSREEIANKEQAYETSAITIDNNVVESSVLDKDESTDNSQQLSSQNEQEKSTEDGLSQSNVYFTANEDTSVETEKCNPINIEEKSSESVETDATIEESLEVSVEAPLESEASIELSKTLIRDTEDDRDESISLNLQIESISTSEEASTSENYAEVASDAPISSPVRSDGTFTDISTTKDENLEKIDNSFNCQKNIMDSESTSNGVTEIENNIVLANTEGPIQSQHFASEDTEKVEKIDEGINNMCEDNSDSVKPVIVENTSKNEEYIQESLKDEHEDSTKSAAADCKDENDKFLESKEEDKVTDCESTDFHNVFHTDETKENFDHKTNDEFRDETYEEDTQEPLANQQGDYAKSDVSEHKDESHTSLQSNESIKEMTDFENSICSANDGINDEDNDEDSIKSSVENTLESKPPAELTDSEKESKAVTTDETTVKLTNESTVSPPSDKNETHHAIYEKEIDVENIEKPETHEEAKELEHELQPNCDVNKTIDAENETDNKASNEEIANKEQTNEPSEITTDNNAVESNALDKDESTDNTQQFNSQNEQEKSTEDGLSKSNLNFTANEDTPVKTETCEPTKMEEAVLQEESPTDGNEAFQSTTNESDANTKIIDEKEENKNEEHLEEGSNDAFESNDDNIHSELHEEKRETETSIESLDESKNQSELRDESSNQNSESLGELDNNENLSKDEDLSNTGNDVNGNSIVDETTVDDENEKLEKIATADELTEDENSNDKSDNLEQASGMTSETNITTESSVSEISSTYSEMRSYVEIQQTTTIITNSTENHDFEVRPSSGNILMKTSQDDDFETDESEIDSPNRHVKYSYGETAVKHYSKHEEVSTVFDEINRDALPSEFHNQTFETGLNGDAFNNSEFSSTADIKEEIH